MVEVPQVFVVYLRGVDELCSCRPAYLVQGLQEAHHVLRPFLAGWIQRQGQVDQLELLFGRFQVGQKQRPLLPVESAQEACARERPSQWEASVVYIKPEGSAPIGAG